MTAIGADGRVWLKVEKERHPLKRLILLAVVPFSFSVVVDNIRTKS